MQKYSQSTRTLSIVTLLVLSGLFGWIILSAIESNRQFVERHNAVSQESVDGLSSQLRILVSELQRSAEIYAYAHTDILEKLSIDPDNTEVIEQMAADLKLHFPEFVSFTVATDRGELLIDDLGETVGELCIKDIREFSSGTGNSMVLHPGPEKPHIDVMVRWRTVSGVSGIFFIGISPEVLVAPLRNIQANQHDLFVLRKGQQRNLIEVSADGHRLQMDREPFLSESEMARISASSDIAESQWVVIDMPEAGLLLSHQRQVIWQTTFLIFLILLIAGIMTFLVIRESRARRQYEQQLLIAKEVAERASQVKSDFLSSMSHELRTPLNAIIGYAQILQSSDGGEQQKSDASEIIKAGEHLLNLINQILDMARIEAGKIKLDIKTVKVDEIVGSSVSLVKSMAEKRQIRLLIKNNCEPESQVLADPLRLKQVLLNLLSNAIKYNYESGKVTLQIENMRNQCVRFTVTDTGPGLTEEQQSQLFKPFERVGLEHPEQVEGTGIGLVISKDLVEMMNGYIGCVSERGLGSSFWVDLPVRQDVLSGVSNYSLEESGRRGMLTKESPEQDILYIEDNPDNQKLMARLFETFTNYRLTIAANANDGLEMVSKNQPEAILMDINLPGMSGLEALQQLRGNDETNAIPVIAVSANALDEDIEQGLASGFDAYITKPVQAEKLLQAIRHAMDENDSA